MGEGVSLLLLLPSLSILPLPLGGGGYRWGREEKKGNPLLNPPPLRGGGYIGDTSSSLREGEDSFKSFLSNSLFLFPVPFPLFYMYNIFLSIDKNVLQSNEGKDIFPPILPLPLGGGGLRWGRAYCNFSAIFCLRYLRKSGLAKRCR